MLTTDRDHPELGHGETEGRNKVYLILSDEERARGFIRPVRRSYEHVGVTICGKEKKFDGDPNTYYCKSKPGHEGECGPAYRDKNGIRGCGAVTTMAVEIAETYARKPDFYGLTFCVGCNKHLPVEEFVWEGTNEKVGS